MNFYRETLLLTLLTVCSPVHRIAYACASCGSGFADPIFLAPDERVKTLLSIKSSKTPYFLSTSGNKDANNLMANQKNIAEVGTAIRLSPKANIGIFWGFQNNRSKKDTTTSLIDPTVSLRYTIMNQSFLSPYIPQIQLLSSFKLRTGRGASDSQRIDMLDVFGTDYSQVSVGVDFWNSMNSIFYGVSYGIQHSFQRNLSGYESRLGRLHSTLFTTGTYYYRYNKIVAGYANLYRDHRYEDGRKIATSDMLQHGFFTTIDYSLNSNHQLRLSLSKSGLGSSRNTSETTTLSIGYLQKWL